MSLNIEEWKEFKFGNLIDEIYKGKAINKDDLSESTDKSTQIRYITRTAVNNGCELLADIRSIDELYIENKNAITIGDTTATCFYQSEMFIVGDHMVIIRADWLNETTGLYVVALLSNEQYKYSYGRAYLMERIKDTSVKLPIKNIDGKPIIDESHKYSEEGYIPDWAFMERFMKSLHHKPLTTKNKAENSLKFDISEWKEFYLEKLFDIKKGKRLTSADQEEGENNYIGAIDSNNGVANHIAQAPIHKGNTISLSYNGSVGEAFYQKEPYWATDDVNALYSYYEGFNEKIGLFIATVLRQEKYKFSYGRKWTLENMNITIIKLPILHNKDGMPVIDETHKYSEQGYVPDWQFMENYIKSLPYGDRLKDVI